MCELCPTRRGSNNLIIFHSVDYRGIRDRRLSIGNTSKTSNSFQSMYTCNVISDFTYPKIGIHNNFSEDVKYEVGRSLRSLTTESFRYLAVKLLTLYLINYTECMTPPAHLSYRSSGNNHNNNNNNNNNSMAYAIRRFTAAFTSDLQ